MSVLTSKNELCEVIKSKLMLELNVADPDQIDLNMDFANLGLNSVQIISLIGELEQSYHLNLDISEFEENLTIATLCDKIFKDNHVDQDDSDLDDKEPSSIKSQVPLHKRIEAIKNLREQVLKLTPEPLYFLVNDKIAGAKTYISGKEYLNFSSYNYLNLSGNKIVTRETINAIKKHGTSASGSRLVGGEKPIHRQLEQAISQFLGTEDALVYNSGHATNVTTIGHLMQKDDLIILDQLSHNSLIEGAKLSHATIKYFQHNSVTSLEKILSHYANDYQNILVVTEGVFSMDGDIAPLPGIIALKHKYQFLLYVDEAHSLGVIGDHGKGISEYYHININDVDIWMGTLSKALASSGGYVSGKQELIDFFRYSSPGFVYSCGLSPADTASALASLTMLAKEPQRVHKLQTVSHYLLTQLQKRGFNTGLSEHTAIIPVIIGDSVKTIELCYKLRMKHIYLQALFAPVVEENKARLRIFVNSSHTKKQMDTLVQALTSCAA